MMGSQVQKKPRRVLIARPRLDCSFKPGPVPPSEGKPLNEILGQFGEFIDGIASYHRSRGDIVLSDTRPLWQFGLDEMQKISAAHDIVYFPHRLRSQFPIGPNALYYKNAALLDHFSIDPAGWGASLTFLPPAPVAGARHVSLSTLRAPLAANRSIFKQPLPGPLPVDKPYLLFLCQLPHDETIQFHSQVSVEHALDAVIAYAESSAVPLIVKGHPANPQSMEPLRQRTERSRTALWVDNRSIHSCLEAAKKVFLVNSGSGFEAILHDRTLLRFGYAEYDSVVPLVLPNPESIAMYDDYEHDSWAYAEFITSFAQNCVNIRDSHSYAVVIERAATQLQNSERNISAH